MTDTTSAQNRTRYYPGTFVWHEYMATDPAAAEKFYTSLFGWRCESVPMGDAGTYRLLYAGDKQVGGIYQLDPAHGAPAHWVGYVSVPDVDASAKAAGEAGGRVLTGPHDIPNVGRFAVIMDPQGAVFAAFKDAKGDVDSTGMPQPGEFAWDTLNSTDLDASAAFYAKVVGWTAPPAPEGLSGRTFNMGDSMEASLNPAPAGAPAFWATHIAVTDLAEANKKAVASGAKVIEERIDIPYGSLSFIQDPFGAMISLLGPTP
jgi:hypothetical protein